MPASYHWMMKINKIIFKSKEEEKRKMSMSIELIKGFSEFDKSER